jgi:hypothetical protein
MKNLDKKRRLNKIFVFVRRCFKKREELKMSIMKNKK